MGLDARGRLSARLRIISLTLLALAGLAAPAPSFAQPIWLDEPPVQWNQPGMPIPRVPDSETEPGFDPRCEQTLRPAESPEDAAIEAAGWRLFGSYESGWGIRLVAATSGHDGMCRPWAYHGFVFVDGAFAGTLAPEPSLSRTDGAWSSIESGILDADHLNATFIRYAPDDPLCCPSRPWVRVSYRIDRLPEGPVLVATQRSEIPRE